MATGPVTVWTGAVFLKGAFGFSEKNARLTSTSFEILDKARQKAELDIPLNDISKIERYSNAQMDKKNPSKSDIALKLITEKKTIVISFSDLTARTAWMQPLFRVAPRLAPPNRPPPAGTPRSGPPGTPAAGPPGISVTNVDTPARPPGAAPPDTPATPFVVSPSPATAPPATTPGGQFSSTTGGPNSSHPAPSTPAPRRDQEPGSDVDSSMASPAPVPARPKATPMPPRRSSLGIGVGGPDESRSFDSEEEEGEEEDDDTRTAPATTPGRPPAATPKRPPPGTAGKASGRRPPRKPSMASETPRSGRGAPGGQGAADPLPMNKLRKLAPATLDPYSAPRVPEESHDDSTLAEVDWNALYQARVDADPSHYPSPADKDILLAEFLGKFMFAARRYGRIIVDEYHLPSSQKRIKHPPSSEEVYIKNGILFKLAVQGEFSDEREMKLAGLELRSVEAYNRAHVPGLHTVLLALIDYRGFRVVATVALPIQPLDNQLVYCVTEEVELFDVEVSDLLAQAAQKLNLKGFHVIGKTGKTHLLHAHNAVRGFLGTDGRVYVTNLLLCFPPDLPQEGNKEQMLTKLLRPELVRAYPRPIASCAYDGEEVDAVELANASHYLRQVVIPAFVKRLDMLDLVPGDSAQFRDLLSNEGINTRFLGVIAETAMLPHTRQLAVIEMVARTAKMILERNLRRVVRSHQTLISYGSEPPVVPEKLADEVKLHVVDFFNLVLGSSDESEQYWSTMLSRESRRHFNYWVDTGTVHRVALFYAMEYHCGVMFHHSDDIPFDTSAPFAEDDLILVDARCTVPTDMTMPTAQHAFALRCLEERRYPEALAALSTRLKHHTLLNGVDNPASAPLLAELCIANAQAGNFETAIICGKAALGVSLRFHVSAARAYLALMEAYFVSGQRDKALECHKHGCDAITYHWGPFHPLLLDAHDKLGDLYCSEKDLLLGIEQYCRSHALATKILGASHPLTASYCTKLGDYYRATNQHDRAIEMYEKALMVHETINGVDDPTTAFSCYFLSLALFKKGDMRRALEYAQKGLRMREVLYGKNHKLTIESYYQVAKTADKLDLEDVAIPAFEGILLKLKGDIAAGKTSRETVEQIQEITTSIVQLKFRLLLPRHRLILDRIRSQNTHQNDPQLIEKIISRMFEESPSKILALLFDRLDRSDNNAYVELATVAQLCEDDTIILYS